MFKCLNVFLYSCTDLLKYFFIILYSIRWLEINNEDLIIVYSDIEDEDEAQLERFMPSHLTEELDQLCDDFVK